MVLGALVKGSFAGIPARNQEAVDISKRRCSAAVVSLKSPREVKRFIATLFFSTCWKEHKQIPNILVASKSSFQRAQNQSVYSLSRGLTTQKRDFQDANILVASKSSFQRAQNQSVYSLSRGLTATPDTFQRPSLREPWS